MKNIFKMERFVNPEYRLENKEEMKRIEKEARKAADRAIYGNLM